MRSTPPQSKTKWVIGSKEYIDFPDWHIRRIRARVDTGAKTCALHVENIEVLPKNHLRFTVVLRHNHPQNRIKIKAAYHRKGHVRSSSGKSTSRYFVWANVRIGQVKRKVEVNLIDRSKMRYRMLIGRSALDKWFIVDVAHSYLLSSRLKAGKKKKR